MGVLYCLRKRYDKPGTEIRISSETKFFFNGLCIGNDPGVVFKRALEAYERELAKGISPYNYNEDEDDAMWLTDEVIESKPKFTVIPGGKT